MENESGHRLHAAVTTLQSVRLNVVELRRYALLPGRRDDLIRLFEREFIESQEACGMLPIGHYRDLDDVDSFVWLRGFENRDARPRALGAFYLESEAWLNHRAAANATMVDSDNVLLLRPARPSSTFDLAGLQRPELNEFPEQKSFVCVAVLYLDAPADDDFIEAFEGEPLPALASSRRRVAYFVSEDQPNNFPRLPVRDREWAFVITGTFADPGELRHWANLIEHGRLPDSMRRHVSRIEVLRLEPAPRALLR